MDKRTLQIVHEFDHEPTYIVTCDDDHEDVATVEPTTPNAVEVADELVRRWNSHAGLTEKVKGLKALLRQCLSYVPAAGDEDLDLREAIEDALKA